MSDKERSPKKKKKIHLPVTRPVRKHLRTKMHFRSGHRKIHDVISKHK